MAEHGFLDPVFDAQRVFRTLLAALSEPGRILRMDRLCAPPGGVPSTAIAVVLALCDADTPLWLAPKMRGAADFLRFQTGAPIIDAARDASFLLSDASERPALALLRSGEAEYPDRSATLILAVDRVEGGVGWRVSGPGIPDARAFLPIPIDDAFVTEWDQNRTRFPLGVDVLFVARDGVVGLPRTTKLES